MIATLISQRFSLFLTFAMVFCYSPFSYAIAPANKGLLNSAVVASAPTTAPTAAPVTTAAASAAMPVIAQVIWVKGVMKAAQPTKAPRVLQRRSAVYEHDVITTDASGTGQLAFTDGSVYALRPGTEFRIDNYHYNKGGPPAEEKSIVNLIKGGFRTITGAIPKENPEGYQVNSPVATIGVRGTEYTTFLSSSKGLFLEIDKGSIKVANEAGSMVLTRCEQVSQNCQFYGNVSNFHVTPTVLPNVPKELVGQPPLTPVSTKTIGSISSSSIAAPAVSSKTPPAGTGKSGSSSMPAGGAGSTGGGTGGTGGTGSTGGTGASGSSSSSPTINSPGASDNGATTVAPAGGGSTTITVTPPTATPSAPKAVGGFCVGMLGTVLGQFC